jgi:hypothetical protein
LPRTRSSVAGRKPRQPKLIAINVPTRSGSSCVRGHHRLRYAAPVSTATLEIYCGGLHPKPTRSAFSTPTTTEPVRLTRQYSEQHARPTSQLLLPFAHGSNAAIIGHIIHFVLFCLLQRGAWLLMAPLDGGG